MAVCAFCGAKDDTVEPCPDCGLYYCEKCVSVHIGIERSEPFVFARRIAQETQPSFYAVWRLDDRDTEGMKTVLRAREAYRRRISHRLKDTEGASTPAATTPKVYRGGGGSPDEPPEAAGAPNIARVNSYLDNHHFAEQ